MGLGIGMPKGIWIIGIGIIRIGIIGIWMTDLDWDRDRDGECYRAHAQTPTHSAHTRV